MPEIAIKLTSTKSRSGRGHCCAGVDVLRVTWGSSTSSNLLEDAEGKGLLDSVLGMDWPEPRVKVQLLTRWRMTLRDCRADIRASCAPHLRSRPGLMLRFFFRRSRSLCQVVAVGELVSLPVVVLASFLVSAFLLWLLFACWLLVLHATATCACGTRE